MPVWMKCVMLAMHLSHLCSQQVALKQQQQHAPEMPPGFSPGSPPAPPRPSVAAKGPPPGFAAAGAAAGPPPGMGTLPGFPRSRTQVWSAATYEGRDVSVKQILTLRSLIQPFLL